MKRDLLEDACVNLLRSGFTVKSLTRSCFDVIARKGSDILLLKMLEDANAISPGYADEMLRIGAYTSASPLIIAEKAGKSLNDGVVYSRFGVYTLTLGTLKKGLESRMPLVKQSRAGLTICISGTDFRQKREELGYSLQELSRRLGVSRRMIIKYEDGSEVSIETASKMRSIFGDNIFKTINLFGSEKQITHPTSSEIGKKYSWLGFSVLEARHAPFDIAAKRNAEIILTDVGDLVNPHLDSVTRLLDAFNLVIFNKNKPKDVPALRKSEFLEFDDGSELIKFVKEY